MTSATAARIAALTSWHHDWSGLRVAVLGLGPIGFSVADTLVELGSVVRVISASPDTELDRLLEVIGAERELANGDAAQLAALEAAAPDLVIVAPEVRLDHPAVTWAREQDITVWGDIELGWRLRDKTRRIADWICVTGANGKSATAQLTALMLAAGGLRVTPTGGTAAPILDALRDPQGYDALVVELSSVQLARLGTISPYASVCLNAAPDHGDWHGSAAAALAAQARVYEHTQIACVYNRADPATERMVEEADVVEGARAISFGIDSPPPSGFGVVEGILVDRGFHAERGSEAFELVTVEELATRGLAAPHTAQNILAAAALARSRGVAPGDIASAVLSYQPEPHRAQFLGLRAGLQWVDDSAATNAHAADAVLRALTDVVWIVGGIAYDGNLEGLLAAHAHRLRGVVVIGEDRAPLLAAIHRQLGSHPVTEIDEAAAPGGDGIAAAVAAAAAMAQPGDTVLLSPAAPPERATDPGQASDPGPASTPGLVSAGGSGTPAVAGQRDTERGRRFQAVVHGLE